MASCAIAAIRNGGSRSALRADAVKSETALTPDPAAADLLTPAIRNISANGSAEAGSTRPEIARRVIAKQYLRECVEVLRSLKTQQASSKQRFKSDPRRKFNLIN
jgi:hypothetical protein